MPEYITDAGPRISIEDPEIKEAAQNILSQLKLSVLKGVANATNPEVFPLAKEEDSVEKATIAYFNKRPAAKQASARQHLEEFLAQPEAVRVNLFGPLARVDLKSEAPVFKQVETLGLIDAVRIKPERLAALTVSYNRLRLSTAPIATYNALTPVFLPGLTGEVVTRSPIFTLDPIQQKYQTLGGATGFLGAAQGGRGSCPDGKGKFQHYEHGSIYWSPQTGAFEVHGAIKAKWKSLGWETSFLGYPITDERTTPDGVGRYNHFQGGSIYWTPATGAHEVHGAIRNKWAAMGWEKSYLGYPVTDERKTPDTIGRYNHFQGGSIYWTPDPGAHAVHINIRNKWEALHWELGDLGYPMADTSISGNSMSCNFQGGYITWTSSGGVKEHTPITRLRFRVHKVKCIYDTDPEWFSDEIDMSGVAVSVNVGKTVQVPRFTVSDDFDDGEQVVYNPPKDFYTFNLMHIPGWPKHFTMTMSLAEIDNGGFGGFLKKLLEAIRSAVVKWIVEKTAQIVGSALGSLIGSLGGPIGSAIGVLVGWLLGELIDWLLSLFEDDIFPVWTAKLALPSVWHRWGVFTDTPEGNYWTQAHGGKYQVWFDWQLLP